MIMIYTTLFVDSLKFPSGQSDIANTIYWSNTVRLLRTYKCSEYVI